jgi:uncharacterized LabA/DUF88 family protein
MKTGIYVDAENVRLNGGFGMRYDVLREYASLEGGVVLRANSYVVEDEERMRQDPESAERLAKYFAALRNFGYKVVKKEARHYRNDLTGEVETKANADMDLAIDALVQSDKLDRVILVSGDGDFARLVHAIQNKGCRVDVIGFKNVSKILRESADRYYNGYLLPGLLPIVGERALRGTPDGDRVSTHGYGFFHTLRFKNNQVVDETVFFHVTRLVNQLHQEKLESPYNVFEFDLGPSERREGDVQASNIALAVEGIRI